MKKILLIILVLFMYSATCSAEFNPPNPERWELFKDTGNILCYFNREAVEITEQPYGRSAKVWVTTYDVTIKIEAMMDWELNLDREEWRMLSGNIYDEEGNELLATANPEEFKAIPKGSVIEDLYRDLGGREKHTEEPAENGAEDKDINKGEAETPAEAEAAAGAEKKDAAAPEKAEGADKEEPQAAPGEAEAAAAADKDIEKGEPQAAPEEPQAAPEEPQAAPEEPQAAQEEPEAAAAADQDMNQGEPQAAPEEPQAASETAPETADVTAAAPAEAGAEV